MLTFHKFLVSKESAVLRRWEILSHLKNQHENLVLSNELIKVELPQ